MTMIRAFARSRVLKGPVRADVDMAMTKWWGKQRPAEGQITRTISAHEQFVVGPWLKTFPQKVIRRAPTYIMWPGGALLLTWGSIKLAADATHAEDFSHRP